MLLMQAAKQKTLSWPTGLGEGVFSLAAVPVLETRDGGNTTRAENSRLGFATKNPALHLGQWAANSRTPLGLPVSCSKTALGHVVPANNGTPWYHNTCITSALAKGAASTALDAVGTFVPAGGAAEGAVAGAFSLWRGAAGVSQGRNVFQGVMLAGGIVNTASAGSEGNGVSVGLGVLGIAATLGKAAPGVGQIISGISMGVDIVQTIQAVGKCQ